MEKFYFHVRTANEILIDDEGSALANYSSAQREAEESVREMLASSIRFGRKIPDAIVIADKKGSELGAVSFESVLLASLRK